MCIIYLSDVLMEFIASDPDLLNDIRIIHDLIEAYTLRHGTVYVVEYDLYAWCYVDTRAIDFVHNSTICTYVRLCTIIRCDFRCALSV